MSKDFGPVEGYLDPANKSWEQATWRTGRPPLDKEFNLAGELFLRRMFRELELPSGFLMTRDYYSPDIFPKSNLGDYVDEPGSFRASLPSASPVANTFYFGPGQVAHVANMPVYLRNKTDEWLPITLNAAPTGVAVKRFDLVFIEVWRAGLSGDPTTDTANGVRDASEKIFYNGWADSPVADNFTDDIFDATAGQETSRRVQIQWRIRVVDDIDLDAFPDGIGDTSLVFAQGPSSSPTTVIFSNAGSPSVAATGVLTLTGLPLNTETTVIGSKTYTWQDTLTNVDGNVKIAGTASDSLDNLIAAIDLGAGSGTLYAAATTDPGEVDAAAGTGDTMDITATVAGVAGNSLTSTETLTNGSWGDTTLLGGIDQLPTDPNLFVSIGHSNTVDGKIYAIPLCAVARRNQETWAKDSNQNGGTGVRPIDTATHDSIEEQDIIDLRTGISRNWDYDELLRKNMSWLLDGKLKTYWGDHGLGGGERGTYFTQADEVGPVDTAGATKIDEFDGFKKQFSDAIVANEAYVQVELSDRTFSTSGTEWRAGDTFDIALPGVSEGIIDRVLEIALFSGSEVLASHFVITGMNTQTVTVEFVAPFESDIIVGQRTNVDLFVKIGLSWPGGRGLSRDPLLYQQDVEVGSVLGTLETGDNFVYESGIPTGLTSLDPGSNYYRPSRTATLLANFTYTSFGIDSRSTTTTVLPNNISSVVGIFDEVADPGKTTDLFVSFTGNVITHDAVPATNRSMLVDYISIEPIPTDEQVTMYYQAAAPQTVNVSATGLNVTDVKLHIVHAPHYLYTITAGSGSHQPGFPYISPGSAIPISAGGFSGEHDFDLNQAVSVDDFGTTAQFIQLPVNVPLAYIPFFDFTDVGTDGEGRYFYNNVSNTAYDDEVSGSPVAYEPAVFAKLLQAAHAHKVAYPCIAMCIEDTALGRRGTLLLLVFTRTSDDAQNAVIFETGAGGSSCVAVYRMKGNPTLSPRKRQLGHPLIEV